MDCPASTTSGEADLVKERLARPLTSAKSAKPLLSVGAAALAPSPAAVEITDWGVPLAVAPHDITRKTKAHTTNKTATRTKDNLGFFMVASYRRNGNFSVSRPLRTLPL